MYVWVAVGALAILAVRGKEDGRRKTEDGRWKMENGKRFYDDSMMIL